MFGLAAGRRHVCIETRARNAVSVLFPDASRYRPQESVIAAKKPRSARGNAPFTRLLAAARTGGMPARLSRDAGRYLCNYAYWQALHHARNGKALVAFVHIPRIRLTPARTSKHHAPSLPQLVGAAEAILIALVSAQRAITARRSA